ncbi:uncharacterized protein LOC111320381 [Stylophora pistillata]|uniref:uncharacterized protein LOC111320381 n=1 Tax=Stylophora pistillata TaxID=50429 RepID=UPI000C04AD52|nr:uncharacterized protein LOC111320381 [Stylophora pistillata]
MTEDLLAALQDLAVYPSLREAQLNSAQCVTGRFPDIEATGRSHYLRALLWCSIICDMLLSPILVYFILAYLEISDNDERNCKLCCPALAGKSFYGRQTADDWFSIMTNLSLTAHSE